MNEATYTWHEREGQNGAVTDVFGPEPGVFLSYQPNILPEGMERGPLDSENPETALVLMFDQTVSGRATHRFLIFRGDWRERLTALGDDVPAMVELWREHGGHFWSDELEGSRYA